MKLLIFLVTWPNQVHVADPVVVLLHVETITVKEIVIGSRMLQTPFKLAPIVVNVNLNVWGQDQKDVIMLVSDLVIRILVLHVGKWWKSGAIVELLSYMSNVENGLLLVKKKSLRWHVVKINVLKLCLVVTGLLLFFFFAWKVFYFKTRWTILENFEMLKNCQSI